jgi:NDP-sugar pyrophosphorylase family protein
MKAVLLAAGRGTRLAPLTDTIPKILVPIAKRPLLDHQLAYLDFYGFTEVAINVHHHAPIVKRALLGTDTRRRIRTVVFEERELLGTAGALLPMRDFLTDTFIVLYGDVLTDTDLRAFLAHHATARASATLAYYRGSETSGKGTLAVDVDGRVRHFAEKSVSDHGTMINAGLYAVEPTVLDLITPEQSDFGFHIWPAALQAGHRLSGFEITGYVRDIGSPDALAAAEREIRNGRFRW